MDVIVKTKASKRGYGENAETEPIDIEIFRDEKGTLSVRICYTEIYFTPEQIDDFLDAVELVKKY